MLILSISLPSEPLRLLLGGQNSAFSVLIKQVFPKKNYEIKTSGHLGFVYDPAGICLFKVNSGIIKTMCGICSS